MNKEMNKIWIPLNEYSQKYKVSISTLRRRIKSAQVDFRYSEGKYLLSDTAQGPPQRRKERAVQDSAPFEELKSAYELALKNKQDQILQLQNQVADLQTLVRILDSKQSEDLTTSSEFLQLDI